MKLYFSESISILRKTAPFIIARGAVYGIMAGISAVYFLILFGFFFLIKKMFGDVSGVLSIFFIIAGAGGFYGLFVIARNYVLHLLKSAHIAVVTELIETGEVKDTAGQVEYGKQKVKEMFKEFSLLFVLDQLIKGVIKAINRTIARITHWLPIAEDHALVKVVQSIVNLSITYIDEAVLCYAFKQKSDNIWKHSATAIVLYTMNWKSVLLHAVTLTGISVVSWVAFFIPSMLFWGIFAKLMPSLGVFFFLVAVVCAYFLKLTLFNPFAMVSIILSFLHETKDQTPDPVWEEKITAASEKFRELKKRALDYAASHSVDAVKKKTPADSLHETKVDSVSEEDVSVEKEESENPKKSLEDKQKRVSKPAGKSSSSSSRHKEKP